MTHSHANEALANQVIERQLLWRYATKQFDPKRRISTENMHTLELTLLNAPSSFGLQPWKFIVVNDQVLREQLIAHTWGQRQVVEASHLIVFAAKRSVGAEEIDVWTKRIAQVREIPEHELSEYKSMMMDFLVPPPVGFNVESWSTHQLYLALGMLLTTAAMLGIDTCPMEGLSSVQYDELLELTTTGYSTKVACALGYRASNDPDAQAKKVRHDPAEVFIRR